MQQTFAAEGLQYSMGGDTGNTRNSHRLLAWAAAEHGLDKQNQLAEALFNGYFCKVLRHLSTTAHTLIRNNRQCG
jgi:predicted DsbA family dithiol-disulfide isomerase